MWSPDLPYTNRMKAALPGHTFYTSQIPSNLHLHCLYLAEDAAQLLQCIADCTQILGRDFGSNLVNVLSPLCQIPPCRNPYGATRVPAAPVSALHRLCVGLWPSPSRAEFCFSCIPGTVGTQQTWAHTHRSQCNKAELLPCMQHSRMRPQKRDCNEIMFIFAFKVHEQPSDHNAI